MRYVPRNCIVPEAVLAKPIIGPSGETLLSVGVNMTEKYIRNLERLGISGVYVDDPISEDLTIVEAISDELRAQAVRNIASIYSGEAQGSATAQARAVMKTAGDIVDEIISHGDVMFNLVDLKAYDSYTFFHCVNVTVLSVVIGLGLDFDRNKLIDLAYAALFHDIGKVFIEPAIINKRGPLTDDEYAIVKKHPRDGYEHIKDIYLTPELTARGVLDHHEKVDGSGYPDGKHGTQITEFGRVIAVADVYDALISDRPYRNGWFAVDAVEYIQGNSGKHFDHDMVKVFSRKVAPFPAGTCVMLSNGAVGLVMENFEGFSQRPLLKVFKHDQQFIDPFFLDMRNEAFDITIVGTIAA